MAQPIRERAAEIALKRRYPKIPGNPFSSSRDSSTVNCNEFVYSLFRLAIAELLAESETRDPGRFAILSAAYAKNALLRARQIRIQGPGNVPALIAMSVEMAAKAQVNHPDVAVAVEGSISCLVGAEWYCFVSEVVLESFTPNSFIYSPFFREIERRECGR